MISELAKSASEYLRCGYCLLHLSRRGDIKAGNTNCTDLKWALNISLSYHDTILFGPVCLDKELRDLSAFPATRLPYYNHHLVFLHQIEEVVFVLGDGQLSPLGGNVPVGVRVVHHTGLGCGLYVHFVFRPARSKLVVCRP